MIWFTSDWHIGHSKDFCYGARGFNNTTDMDTAILYNCNKFVKQNDTLYILGDLAMSSVEEEWNRVYYNLICQDVHYLQGNHDTNKKMDIFDDEYRFTYEGLATIIRYGKYHFYLSHYPTLVGKYDDNDKPLKHRLINLCGHTHTKDKFSDMDKGLIYHVEVDAHDCCPISIEQIIADIKIYYEEQYIKYK